LTRPLKLLPVQQTVCCEQLLPAIPTMVRGLQPKPTGPVTPARMSATPSRPNNWVTVLASWTLLQQFIVPVVHVWSRTTRGLATARAAREATAKRRANIVMVESGVGKVWFNECGCLAECRPSSAYELPRPPNKDPAPGLKPGPRPFEATIGWNRSSRTLHDQMCREV
jgi:hypothetical protein